MYCEYCGKEINDKARFCKYCGEVLSDYTKAINDEAKNITNNKDSISEESTIEDKKKTTIIVNENKKDFEPERRDVAQLYHNLKYNKQALTPKDILTLLNDFKDSATKCILDNNSGNYKIEVTEQPNGILLINHIEQKVLQFNVNYRKGYKKTVEIDDNTSIYVVGANISYVEDDDIITAAAQPAEETQYRNEEYGNLYILDFLKSVIRKSNYGALLWIILNTALVTFVIGKIICMNDYRFEFQYPWAAYLIGFVTYIISIIVALSPIGELILRLQTGCKTIKRKDYLDRLNPLFEEVYIKAKKRNPNLPNEIKFYMSKDEEPNAFATGRKTICITEGLMNYSDEEIKSVLGHEFGHLAHKDTDVILVVHVGNLIVTGMFIAFRLFVNIVTFIFHIVFAILSESFVEVLISAFTRVLIDFILVGVMTIWTKIGVLLCMHSSRKNEFEADAYSVALGYGETLCQTLDKLDADRTSRSKATLWASLNSTHPETDDRIAHMQMLGVKYSKYN